MKYLDKKFSSPANSRAYVDNWSAIFGEETERTPDPEETKPETEQSSSSATP